MRPCSALSPAICSTALELKSRPNFGALEEFLLRGLKYVFPPERGELTRGVPTSYAAEPLRSIIAQGNEPIPVWPYEESKQRGISFEPLYRTAPIAALRDPSFYEYLALADALRDSRVRERRIAEKELCRRLREASERTKSEERRVGKECRSRWWP